MVLFPNCKINLGLHITGKREDGYHDLETIFFPVPLTDALEINKGIDPSNKLVFNTSGINIDGDHSNNLCVKAYQLLQKDFQDLPLVNMHLHKQIPMGAGLGGGSSNGAFALKMLNIKFNLRLSDEQLIQYALQLGSDCPFFIVNKPCFAHGRGENLEPLDLSLKGYYILLVYPGIHISTREAFVGIQPHKPGNSIKNIISRPIETWKQDLVNNFEETAFEIHPQLSEIKQAIYDSGAVYAAMTGSGSSLFGIFTSTIIDIQKFDNQCFVKTVAL